MQTERVTFLTSPDQKAALDRFASSNGLSVGHILREASAQYIAQPKPDDEEQQLAALVQQLATAVPEMRASLRRSTDHLNSAVAEVDAMLREAGLRR